ncbi:hypothetical protein [Mycolicibacterium aubagnense]|uniref:Uncharacterized protein n=1 Tax=Mycolicibacterium aubagnense TaxID=319707 RepID=A0ABM7INH0_9MYCO|nr:hypothetical protein [Mycolicibacterium aubagnense]BBX88255.1 hypothetical protein MAUB_64560 [Mycolicibacterium aubagnense]
MTDTTDADGVAPASNAMGGIPHGDVSWNDFGASSCLCSATDTGSSEHEIHCPESVSEPELSGRGADVWCAECGRYCGGGDTPIPQFYVCAQCSNDRPRGKDVGDGDTHCV